MGFNPSSPPLVFGLRKLDILAYTPKGTNLWYMALIIYGPNYATSDLKTVRPKFMSSKSNISLIYHISGLKSGYLVYNSLQNCSANYIAY